MLDILTILVLLTCMSGVIGAVFLVFWFYRREPYAYLWWGIGCCFSTGGIFLLASRNQIPDFVSIEIANALILVAPGLWWAGVRDINRQKVGLAALIPCMIWIMLVPIPWINESTTYRTALFSFAMAAGFVMIASSLWVNSTKRSIRRPLALLCMLQVALSLARGGMALGASVPQNIFEAPPWFAVSLFQPILSMFVLSMLGLLVVMEQTEQRLRSAAEIDPLTAALNRRGFLAKGEKALELAAREKQNVGLILFDLDHFKSINDRYGHLAGDDVLATFVALAKGLLRPTDILGRMGGEEFAIILPGADEDSARCVAERIRSTFNKRVFDHGGIAVRASVSAGIAVHPAETARLNHLISKADEALYKAKAAGRNRTKVALARIA